MFPGPRKNRTVPKLKILKAMQDTMTLVLVLSATLCSPFCSMAPGKRIVQVPFTQHQPCSHCSDSLKQTAGRIICSLMTDWCVCFSWKRDVSPFNLLFACFSMHSLAALELSKHGSLSPSHSGGKSPQVHFHGWNAVNDQKGDSTNEVSIFLHKAHLSRCRWTQQRAHEWMVLKETNKKEYTHC